MTAKQESRLKVLVGKKEMYFQRIQTLYNYGKNFQDPASLRNFRIKFKSLESTKTEFMQTLEDIVQVQLSIDADYQPDLKAAESFDDLYCHVLYMAEEAGLVNSQTKPVAEPDKGESSSNTLRLPKITLSMFSGNIKEWPVFDECFKSLIHENDKLNDVDKVNYLVGQLSGRASTVCAGLAPVGSNYKIIWDSLIEKYDNTRVLANSYLEQILELKPASSATANNLNNILENCDSAYQALQKLDIKNLADFVFAYLLFSKLDNETKGLFENTYRKSSTAPTYAKVLEFVQEQARIYTLSAASHKSSNTGYGSKSKPHSFFVGRVVRLVLLA